jgi:riboflavin synthase alpha subunit
MTLFNNFPFKTICMTGALALSIAASPARAQSEASLVLSALPVAAVVVTASTAAGSVAAVGAALSAVPVAFSVVGATLVVKAVEVTASGTFYLLERASDGAQASVRIAGKVASGVVMGVGTVVAVSAIGTGLLLSTAGEVLAFIPNELGKALLHNERVTN